MKSCPRCGLSRYKLKQKDDDIIEDIKKHGPQMKVMWYLPIIPKMKRLFANPNDAKNLRWHVDERKCDGMYRQGHSLNVKSLVSMQDLKLIRLKSHDCHILMQQLLPIAIRGILPKNVRHTISRLCSFFSSVCCKVIDPSKLDELQNEIVVILCELEMFIPPSFFDNMVHLVVHLVREVRLCGIVYLRWMYPIEQYMKILKGYVKNHYRPEASMIERYIA